MDWFSVQRGAYVYWPIHGLCWGLTWSTARSPGCRLLFHDNLLAPPACSQLQSPGSSARARGTYIGNFLSADAYLCAAQHSFALSSIYFGVVCDFRGWSCEHCSFALRLVPGAAFL